MRLVRPIALTALLLLAVAAPPAAHAQKLGLPAAAPAKTATEADPLGRDTPSGCVLGFLRAAERDDYTRAVEYLNIKPSPDAVRRARYLRTVLNSGRVADLENLDRTPEGNLQDGLAADRERIGSVETGKGTIEILLSRTKRGDRQIWLFSAETLRQNLEEVEPIPVRNLESYLPGWLLETRVLSVPLYRWVGTILGIALALGIASLGSWLLLRCIRPVARRITPDRDDGWIANMRAPLWLMLFALGFRMLAGLSLTLLSRRFWFQLAAAMGVIGFTWLVIRISDGVAERAKRRLVKRQVTSKLAVVALLHRLFKVGAGVAGAVLMVYVAGADVTALLAGVGIGGIAVALAAQKTLENLIGGVSVISDEPFRVGELGRFGDKMGRVVDIGLRSTRVRTLDRTMLVIPNGQLSVMTLENFDARDMFLCHQKIRLHYQTTPAQVRSILTEIRELIRRHPLIDQVDARARLIEFADSGFTIEVFLYLLVADTQAHLKAQEELLLTILDIIQATGCSVAIPSRTLYLTRDKPQDAALIEEAAARIQQQSAQQSSAAAGGANSTS